MAIDGTYKGLATSPLATAKCDLTLKAEGNVLTGSASAMGVTAEIKNGTVEGDSFACVVEGTGPLGYMSLDIRGTVSGDIAKGTIQVGRIVSVFEGKRV